MPRQLLEARVLEAVRVVVGGGKVEDDHIECKGKWIEPDKAARLIAGAANAAGGQPIIWILGLGEDQHKIVPLDGKDIADWWPSVSKHFSEEVKPDVQSINIAVGNGQTVLALAFSTDSAPYVVNTKGERSVTREVPWREGTTLRSAYRRDLIRLLVPRMPIPDIAVLDLSVSAKHVNAITIPGLKPSDEHIAIAISGSLYFESAIAVSLPRHLAKMTLRFNSKNLEPIEASVPFRGHIKQSATHPKSVYVSSDAVHIGGSGLAPIQGGFEQLASDKLYIATTDYIEIEFAFGVGLNGASLRISSRLKHITGSEDESSGFLGRWKAIVD